MGVNERICQLMEYGMKTGLIEKEDRCYTINRVLEVMALDDFEDAGAVESADLEDILKSLVDDAIARGVLEDDSIVSRDLFDTKIMGCLVPRPSEVIRKFNALYGESPEAATDY